jgi:hypothetical protein
MMISSRGGNSDYNLFSTRSTGGASQESQQIKNLFNNEWYRAALAQAGHTDTAASVQYIGPGIDYESPAPIRSYKIKVRVISRDKGEPVDYKD